MVNGPFTKTIRQVAAVQQPKIGKQKCSSLAELTVEIKNPRPRAHAEAQLFGPDPATHYSG
jgi:hypothetical protein